MQVLPFKARQKEKKIFKFLCHSCRLWIIPLGKSGNTTHIIQQEAWFILCLKQSLWFYLAEMSFLCNLHRRKKKRIASLQVQSNFQLFIFTPISHFLFFFLSFSLFCNYLDFTYNSGIEYETGCKEEPNLPRPINPSWTCDKWFGWNMRTRYKELCRACF